MIKMQVIGNLGKDCVVNDVNGKKVLNFNVCHTEKYKVNRVQHEKSIWVECAYWATNTGIAPYLLKGTQVHVDGNPEQRIYKKKDGTMGASIVMRVLSVELLGSKKDENGGNQAPAKAAAPAANNDGMPPDFVPTEVPDDMPF